MHPANIAAALSQCARGGCSESRALRSRFSSSQVRDPEAIRDPAGKQAGQEAEPSLPAIKAVRQSYESPDGRHRTQTGISRP